MANKTYVIPVDELDIEFFGKRHMGTRFRRTADVPLIEMIIDGTTVRVEGTGAVGDFLYGIFRDFEYKEVTDKKTGEKKMVPVVYHKPRFNLGGKFKRRSRPKSVGERAYRDIYKPYFEMYPDWHDVYRKIKERMTSLGISHIRFEVSEKTGIPRIESASYQTRAEGISSKQIVEYVSSKLVNSPTSVGEKAVILKREEINVGNRVINIVGGIEAEDNPDHVEMRTFITVGNRKMVVDKYKIYPTNRWKTDVGKSLQGDARAFGEYLNSAIVNAHIPAKLQDNDKRVLTRKFEAVLQSQDVLLAPSAVRRNVDKFEERLSEFCDKNEDTKGRMVCVDVAVHDTIRAGEFPLGIEAPLKKRLIDFLERETSTRRK